MDISDWMDAMDKKAKKDKIHNIKLSSPTFDKFHRLRNEVTLKLNMTRIENDKFLWKIIYFVDKNIEDFIIGFDEESKGGSN